MKEITLKIPTKKLNFYLELFKQLDIEVSEEIEIPDWHKSIVRERIEKSKQNPKRYKKWDSVKDDFKLD